MIVVNATTKQIHERLYHLAKETIRVLERHDIPYSLAFGTLLGAVRHKGFIPWDEDFDLWLFDDCYEEATDYLRKELPEDLFLEDKKSEEKYFHQWAHVKDLNSEVTHTKYVHDDAYKHKGLHIDLYRLKQVKESELYKYLNNENQRYILRRRDLGLMNDEEYERRIEQLEINEKNIPPFDKDVDEDVYALITAYKCKKIYKRNVFPLVRYQFETSSFLGMSQAEKILSDIYGDYMVPTPPEEREGGHASVQIF